MEYVYAALLLHKEKKEINEANISNIIKASGAEVNEAQVKALVAALADVNIDEAIKAAPVAVAAAPAAAPATGGGAKEEKKEVETPSGKSEEEAMQGLSALFG
jgi:large subunit ribosomal protein L12